MIDPLWAMMVKMNQRNFVYRPMKGFDELKFHSFALYIDQPFPWSWLHIWNSNL